MSDWRPRPGKVSFFSRKRLCLLGLLLLLFLLSLGRDFMQSRLEDNSPEPGSSASSGSFGEAVKVLEPKGQGEAAEQGGQVSPPALEKLQSASDQARLLLYAELRTAFEAEDGARVLLLLDALAEEDPASCQKAFFCCLGREWALGDSVEGRLCYQDIAPLCRAFAHNYMDAQNYALVLQMAASPEAGTAVQNALKLMPVADGEYFNELLTIPRFELLRILLRPLGLQ